MPYTVQFVGLACFYREASGYQVLMPDGRQPDDGIEPHYASVIVHPSALDGFTGWDGDANAERGVFSLAPCSLSINAVEENGVLDTSNHDGLLPQLHQLAPNFEIDPLTAQTIVRVRLRNGALAAYRIPGGDAVISQLDVPHDGPITVSVLPDDGSAVRTIQLKPGTEIAFTNMARGGYAAEDDHSGHFRIYEKLSRTSVQLSEPVTVTSAPPSPSTHCLFSRSHPIGLSMACSNTGCC